MLVAHLSDLHLFSLQGARWRDLLGKRVTGALNLLLRRGGEFPVAVARTLMRDLAEQHVDQVVLSGDVTNLAFPSELDLVRRILGELPLGAREVTLVPGNHDYYTRESHRRDHFGQTMRPYLEGDLQPGPGLFPFVRLRGELAIVALSSAVPSPPLMAFGKLGARQLARAEELLDREECRSRFRLVMLHHPIGDPHVHWHNRLLDAGALSRMLRRVGADLVIHGHLHRPCSGSIPGPQGRIPVVGVGSSTWIGAKTPERRAQYNLYRIDGRALTEIRTRRYEPERAEFVESARPALS